jgi:uncharacterized protein (UPF0333 family)
MGAIAVLILIILIANVGGIYFLIQNRKESKRIEQINTE